MVKLLFHTNIQCSSGSSDSHQTRFICLPLGMLALCSLVKRISDRWNGFKHDLNHFQSDCMGRWKHIPHLTRKSASQCTRIPAIRQSGQARTIVCSPEFPEEGIFWPSNSTSFTFLMLSWHTCFWNRVNKWSWTAIMFSCDFDLSLSADRLAANNCM